jgi:hypothetical protein
MLKADGIELSGTVQQGARGSSGYNTTLTMPVAIYGGEIDGNKITFKCQDPWSPIAPYRSPGSSTATR